MLGAAVSWISCSLHGVRPILLSLRRHNSTVRLGDCWDRSFTTGGGKVQFNSASGVAQSCLQTRWHSPSQRMEDRPAAPPPLMQPPPPPHHPEDIQLLGHPRALTGIPQLLTVLLLPAPPQALEELARKFPARRRLQLLPELPSCRRVLRLHVSRLAPQCHMVSEGIGLVRKQPL